MSDPQVSTTPITDPVPTPNKTPASSNDFFGGSDDIFANPDIVQVEPVKIVESEDLPIPAVDQDSYAPDPTWEAKPIVEETPLVEKAIHIDTIGESQPQPIEESYVPKEEYIPPVEMVTPVVEETPVVQEPEIVSSSETARPIDEYQVANTKPIANEELIVPEEETEEQPTAEESELEGGKIDEQSEEKIEPVEEISPVEEDVEPEELPKDQILREDEPVVDISTSELTQKFTELFQMCKKVYELKNVQDGFTLLGADNDKLSITYKFFIGDDDYPMVSVTKEEVEKDTEEQTLHELSFYVDEQGTALNINLDDFLLFEENVDLKEDIKKRMQVSDKLNKFIFLVGEETKKLEKELKEKEAEQEEKKKLQDIFRNF